MSPRFRTGLLLAVGFVLLPTLRAAEPVTDLPQTPQTPQTPTTPKPPPEATPPVTPPTTPPTASQPTTPTDPGESGLALGGEGFALASSNVGYIDSAVPRTQIRLRFDSAYDDNRPDRAEFFYAKYREIGGTGVPDSESKLNYQEVDEYVEYAFNKRVSAFVEVGQLILDPQHNPRSHGWADSNFGFKAAFIATDSQYLTFQLKDYVPTGEGGRGLGTNHDTVEPGLLAFQKLGERFQVEAELRDWIPIDGSDYAGNVIRYGVGGSYAAIKNDRYKLSPVVELVGWTVLSGKESDFNAGPGGEPVGQNEVSARGDTIVNLKAGLRFDFRNHLSLYAGYGHALTGDFWYKDMVRAELRYAF